MVGLQGEVGIALHTEFAGLRVLRAEGFISVAFEVLQCETRVALRASAHAVSGVTVLDCLLAFTLNIHIEAITTLAALTQAVEV